MYIFYFDYVFPYTLTLVLMIVPNLVEMIGNYN